MSSFCFLFSRHWLNSKLCVSLLAADWIRTVHRFQPGGSSCDGDFLGRYWRPGWCHSRNSRDCHSSICRKKTVFYFASPATTQRQVVLVPFNLKSFWLETTNGWTSHIFFLVKIKECRPFSVCSCCTFGSRVEMLLFIRKIRCFQRFRCSLARSSWLRQNYDCKSDGKSIRRSICQPASVITLRQMARGVRKEINGRVFFGKWTQTISLSCFRLADYRNLISCDDFDGFRPRRFNPQLFS